MLEILIWIFNKDLELGTMTGIDPNLFKAASAGAVATEAMVAVAEATMAVEVLDQQVDQYQEDNRMKHGVRKTLCNRR